MRARRVLVACVVAGGCARGGGLAAIPSVDSPAVESPATVAPERAEEVLPLVREEATAGLQDPAWAAVIARHWAATLWREPEWASSLGHRWADGRVRDRSLDAAAEALADARAWLAEAEALPMPRDAGSDDARAARAFLRVLRDDVASADCRFERWSVGPRDNPVVDLLQALDLQPVHTAAARATAVARMGAWRARLPGHADALRAGLAGGLVANAETLRRTVAQLDRLLATPAADWDVARRAREGGDDAPLVAAIDETLPAITAYRDLLRDELLPAAAPEGGMLRAPGLAGLALPPSCYEARIRAFTTRPDTAEALHALGRAQVAKVHEELSVLGTEVFGTGEVPAILARLRDDVTLRYPSAAAIVGAAEEALARAERALPSALGKLPRTPCVVAVIPDHEAPFTTIAYYRQPSPGGDKPGEYFVNTYEPTTRPRYEAEALAFHESVPGHHTQIALSYELPDAPAFLRFGGATAFVEGWALYAERLADELGLYSSPEQRLGMLSFDAWRASRLVVDTGVHALGWSREEAEAYLLANTALAPANVSNEVDRYIAWPGQALAYKVGQLEILSLRSEAEAALGPRFDRRGFHDAVLAHGAVSLEELRRQVEAWVRQELAR